ncbi:hypothetical protein FA048_10970 [Pedobacter polaris]|uniref:Uncharacterized protein n=1 Tax=Pedobacter polaris TaxID=2571273 RepID=A0A4U1CU97_9SPHI|nr:hypothetical protein [Pedobacter polaris]TKC10690.1 hypothetical protein FA048_10970 [Pedobacter polaris]
METEETKLPDNNKKELDMEPINEFDQNHFYETNHLDETHFAEQNRSEEDLGYQEISGTASLADRITEEEKLHQEEEHLPGKNQSTPTKEDGDKLMNVGRAPDS